MTIAAVVTTPEPPVNGDGDVSAFNVNCCTILGGVEVGAIGKRIEAAFKMASVLGISRSSAAKEATTNECTAEADDEFQRPVKLVRSESFNSSGKVEAVDRPLVLSVDDELITTVEMVEWFEVTAPERAKEELVPQPLGCRPALSALMMSAACM